MRSQPYDGLAGSYNATRPSYPRELVARFRELCPVPEHGGLVLDVGAGTGIATRLLRAVFSDDVAIIGIEPGAAMRRTAVAHSSHLPNLAFLNAPAEALPFQQETADAVFVAQALHWFDRSRFYAEAARVLRPGGALGIIENNRKWRASDFLAQYETLLETYGDGYSRDYRRFDIAAELAAAAGLDFESQYSAEHVLEMPKAAFTAWAFTSTKMQACIASAGEAQMRTALSELVQCYFAGEALVAIPYETALFIARRG